MATRHHWQKAHLNELVEVGTYQMENDKRKVLAEQVVTMKYAAPSTKTFSTISENGSGFIRHHVFQKLMKDEAEAGAI